MSAMHLPSLVSPLSRWFVTLKFKIVLMVVLTGMGAALGTTQLVLTSMHADLERLLLKNGSNDRENTAALLADKLDMLQLALRAVARQVTPQMLEDPALMRQFLEERPAVSALFEAVFAARRDGQIVARLERGTATTNLPNIRERDYFQRALRTDQPVVSKPMIGLLSKAPLLIISIPVLDADGTVCAVIGGSLALRSASLFSNLGGQDHADGSRTLVMDRDGVLLAHSDPQHVLGQATDEPGLAEVVGRWKRSGSPIDTLGMSTLEGGYLVSMAGIPTSDWVLVRLVPEAIALEPVELARHTAWRAALAAGLLAGLLAGMLAWHLARPITQLRARADRMLTETTVSSEGWPVGRGEVGDLANAFQQVVDQRQRRQGETEALLQQLEAVLDHAGVGIALTRNGQFELVSRHFCDIFRCEKHEVVGQPTSLIHASDAAYQALSARAHPAFMEHGAFDVEFELVRRTGQPFWAQMRGRAVVPGDRSRGTIWTIEDVTQAREQRERMAWTSSHDSLTGLCNRAAFEVVLEQAAARALEAPCCALFVDLDRFKQVNDNGGHAAGDALLRDIAQALAAQVRHSDVVARLGGDEFAVLLHRCPLSQARGIAEKLRRAVDDYRLVWEGQSFGVGASIGLVSVSGQHASAAEVLRAADAACYAAKRQGRNCIAEPHEAGA